MKKARGRRRSSRRKQMAARWRFVGGFTLVVFALATAMFLGDRPSTQPAPAGEADLAPSSVAPDLQTVSAGVDRAVYPYSIIAGGAQTVDELKQAIAGDPVVAAHYAGFDLEKTQAVRLEQPKLAHVSYRMGNAVYWTRKPLVIAAGETMLTDGVLFARTRCGNQLADSPGEISPAEPPAALLDTPVSIAPARVGSPTASSGLRPVGARASGPSVAPSGGSGSSGTLSPARTPSAAPMTAAGATSDSASNREAPGGSDAPPVPSSSGSNSPGNSGGNSPGGNAGPPTGLPPIGPAAPPSDEFHLPDGPILPPNVPLYGSPEVTLDPVGPDYLDPGDPPGDPLDPPESPLDPSQPRVVPDITTPSGEADGGATIPEPATTILMLGGAVAYAARRIRSKS